MNAETLGYLAGTLTTVAFVPQVWRIWSTKSAHDISWGMFAIFTMGVVLWLVYGIVLDTWPVILANAITLTLAVAVLVLKWRFGRPPHEETP